VVGLPSVTVEQARAIALESAMNFSYQIICENGTVETVSDLKIAPESLGHEQLVYLNYKLLFYVNSYPTFTSIARS
jgi:hypothetical protein